ncbi:hypothetical protein HaLaN_09788, partial [Haematococcus lacustris]
MDGLDQLTLPTSAPMPAFVLEDDTPSPVNLPGRAGA